MLSKIEKFVVLETFVVKFGAFYSSFFCVLITLFFRSLEVVIRKILWIEQKWGLLCQKCFCHFLNFWLFLRLILTKHAVISSETPTGYRTWLSRCLLFKTIYERNCSNFLQKTAKKS